MAAKQSVSVRMNTATRQWCCLCVSVCSSTIVRRTTNKIKWTQSTSSWLSRTGEDKKEILHRKSCWDREKESQEQRYARQTTENGERCKQKVEMELSAMTHTQPQLAKEKKKTFIFMRPSIPVRIILTSKSMINSISSEIAKTRRTNEVRTAKSKSRTAQKEIILFFTKIRIKQKTQNDILAAIETNTRAQSSSVWSPLNNAKR